MKDKLLILAYMGTGKTELEHQYKNVIDLDFQDYKYIYDETIKHLPLEKRNGQTSLRVENPEYPNNFINAVNKIGMNTKRDYNIMKESIIVDLYFLFYIIGKYSKLF